jgi:hypothetical protein
MKTALLIALLALGLAGDLWASGAVSIEITTSEAKPSYALYKQGYGLNREPKTPAEIEAWLRENGKAAAAEWIFIYVDEHTTFQAVQEMLHRCKAAGVKRYSVITGLPPAKVLSGMMEDLRALDAAEQK